MANTRKPKRASAAPPDPLLQARAALADRVASGARVVVGLSGGIDSVVLLDVMRRLATRKRWQLSAVHVNHQLQLPAGQWAAFCRRICRAHGIPLRIAKVAVTRRNNVEGAARSARYEVFARQRADYIALAHNQDDQGETLLLHLLRGAGVRGLAGMRTVAPFPIASADPARGQDALPQVLRPLLDVPRSAIAAYARQRRLEWIDDPSNTDARYLRNFVRAEVLPRVATRVPAYREALARAARHLADASRLLDELAALDGGLDPGAEALAVSRLRGLSDERARNVLRYFLQCHGLDVPSAERLAEALRQTVNAGRDAQLAVDIGRGWVLRRRRDALVLVPAGRTAPADASRVWQGQPALELPEWGGVLCMQRALGSGISAAKLAAGEVTLRGRRGGERLRPDARRPTRSVKNLLQEQGIPAWERDRRPFLYCGDALVWVEGIGIDSAFHAAAGEPSIVPRWLPGGAS